MTADVVNFRFHRDFAVTRENQSRLAADIAAYGALGTDDGDRIAAELAIEYFDSVEEWRHRFIGRQTTQE